MADKICPLLIVMRDITTTDPLPLTVCRGTACAWYTPKGCAIYVLAMMAH